MVIDRVRRNRSNRLRRIDYNRFVEPHPMGVEFREKPRAKLVDNKQTNTQKRVLAAPTAFQQ